MLRGCCKYTSTYGTVEMAGNGPKVAKSVFKGTDVARVAGSERSMCWISYTSSRDGRD